MSEELDNFVFNTAMGWVGVSASAKGLLAVTLPQPSAEAAHPSPGKDVDKATHIPSAFNHLVERLKAYYRGREVAFPDKLDLTGATPFQY
ncbi:MAG TPA: hypothetical protein VGA82_01085, partial [Dehalococcoidales bacterium]